MDHRHFMLSRQDMSASSEDTRRQVLDIYRTFRERPRMIASTLNKKNPPRAAIVEAPAEPDAPRERSDPNPDPRGLEYIGQQQDNLVCPICHSYWVQPMKFCCDHVFCRGCITSALDHQNSPHCPTCRRKASHEDLGHLPRFVDALLDDLRAKCPSTGCSEVVARGALCHHLEHECLYAWVDCIVPDCAFKVRRKDCLAPCEHGRVSCRYCKLTMQRLNLEDHQKMRCEHLMVECPDCGVAMPVAKIKAHAETCPERIHSCAAAPYGCDFAADRSSLDQHQKDCILLKLGPFLADQNARLEEHAIALKQLLRKTRVYQDSIETMQGILGLGPGGAPLPAAPLSAGVEGLPIQPASDPSPGTNADPPPFDSTASHLLSLHELLRQEVISVSSAIRELDAKVDMTSVNQMLRTREEMAHTNAALNQLRIQMQWLMNSRLQQQRVLQPATVDGPSVMRGAFPGGGGQDPAAQGGGAPMRRPSDSGREGTKL
jgi:hypothetical protein